MVISVVYRVSIHRRMIVCPLFARRDYRTVGNEVPLGHLDLFPFVIWEQGNHATTLLRASLRKNYLVHEF